RRIHGDQPDLEGIIEIGAEADRAVEYWLAVFMLPDLQIRCVGGAFDEIASRVDHEQTHAASLDLTAEQKSDLVVDGCRVKRLAFDVLDAAYDATDTLRGLKHGWRVHQSLTLAGFRVFYALCER